MKIWKENIETALFEPNELNDMDHLLIKAKYQREKSKGMLDAEKEI